MAYGEGSVYQRKDGKWVAALPVGYTRSGGLKRATRIRKTEAEAKRALRQLRRDHAAGQTQGASPRTTLKTWCDQWKAAAATRLRPNSLDVATRMIDRWIIPAIGSKRLADLNPSDMRALDRAHEKTGSSPTTAHRCRAILLKVLRDARTEGYQVPQVVFDVPLPRKAPNRRRAIPAADAATILKAATEPDAWPTLDVDATKRERNTRRLAGEHDASRWVAALLQGLRQGEALGLTWDRVDLDAGTLTIDRQLQAVPKRARDAGLPGWYDAHHLTGAYHLVPTKTAAGSRVLPIVPWMAAALATWQDRCPDSPWGLVWPRPDGGPWSATDDMEAWRGLQDAAGVHKGGDGTPDDPWEYYVTHEARHSTATLLMAAGVPAAVIIALMGHTSVTTTLGYQHADLDQARQALEAVAPRLGLASTPAP